MAPLAVLGVPDGVVEVEDLADGLQEVDLVAPVVPEYIQERSQGRALG